MHCHAEEINGKIDVPVVHWVGAKDIQARDLDDCQRDCGTVVVLSAERMMLIDRRSDRRLDETQIYVQRQQHSKSEDQLVGL